MELAWAAADLIAHSFATHSYCSATMSGGLPICTLGKWRVEEKPAPLARGWVACEAPRRPGDSAAGDEGANVYYWHPESGRTQWEYPSVVRCSCGNPMSTGHATGRSAGAAAAAAASPVTCLIVSYVCKSLALPRVR